MNISRVLENLDKTNLISQLATVAPVVAPGAIISNNLEWSNRFREGRAAYFSGNLEKAAQIFVELDIALPGSDRFLTPAKINETFCWLRRGKADEYVQFYQRLSAQNRVYGVVLWNLVVAYIRIEKTNEAEQCLVKWLRAPSIRNLANGHLLLAAIQHRNGESDRAVRSFEKAWEINANFCTDSVSKCLGPENASSVLGVEISPPAKRVLQIPAMEEVILVLQRLLIARPPGKSPQIAQQLSEFEYKSGYVSALEKFGDGDIDGALIILDSLLKGSSERSTLLWAKTACLLAKREWEAAVTLIEDQLDDPGLPGAVLWNASCAYFNLAHYDAAYRCIQGCTESEYRTSAMTWFVQGLLAHLCGNVRIRNDSITAAIRISPRQLIYHVGILRQIGVDIGGFPSESTPEGSGLKDAEIPSRYDDIAARARALLRQGKELQAAQEFVNLAPGTTAEIPEIGDPTFKPTIWPTCPGELYDFKDLFLSGIAAYQRKAYEEAVDRFEDLYRKTDKSHPSVVNLAASLILIGGYHRAEEVLRDGIGRQKLQDAYTFRNLISALVRSEKYDQAFPWYNRLLEVSNKEYFNFVQMARVAELLAKRDDTATALFNACTENLSEPSILLKCAAIRTCLDVKDHDRAFALVRYFVADKPLPYVVAGATRPSMPARNCRYFNAMKVQFEVFERNKDARAALAYFQEVQLAREADYGVSIDQRSVAALFNACLFYARSLFWNQNLERGYEILNQAYNLLADHSEEYAPENLPVRYRALAELYFSRGHYFWALELCDRGMEVKADDERLLRLHGEIEKKLKRIPEKSREAIKELTELQLSTADHTDAFLKHLPKISQLVETLGQDFPSSKRMIARLADLTGELLGFDSIPMVRRKKEISRQREMATRIERDMRLDLPRAFVVALLPVFRGIKKTLDGFQARSVCPEIRLTLEPVSFYRESEASLLFNLRNVGLADIKRLSIKLESPVPDKWAPALEEHSVSVLKKDGVFWIDWPIHLDSPPNPESSIRPRVSLNFTGGSLRDESIEEVLDDQDAKFQPFFDISVEYPVIALKPQDNNKLYGRENLLRTLKNSFTASGQTRIPFLQGVRKVGKTSILYFLAARLPASFLPVYVNLDAAWSNPYQLLAKCVSREMLIRALDPVEHRNVVSREDFDNFLALVKRETKISNVVLLLDEFHAVIERIESGALPSEFLGDLRDIYQNLQQRVSVAVADWYSIDELKRRAPAQLWADFAREAISFLNELDTREAIDFPVQGSPLRFEQGAISRIYHWTNGYPWHVQWVCAELISYLDIQKRYVVILQDIDLIAARLLTDDRLFDEGLCRPERISRTSQQAIYGILETLQQLKLDICGWFCREVIDRIAVPFDLKREVAKLKSLEVLQEQDNLLRFCSPLHALWFEARRSKGIDIHGETSSEEEGIRDVNLDIVIPEDPSLFLRTKCEELKDLKTRLRKMLPADRQVFKNLEMPTEWIEAATVAQSEKSWAIFIGALRDLFVEDMISRLDSWEDRRLYSDMNRELHSIRERRNYVEHPESTQGKAEEEKRCLEDIHRRFATSSTDWLVLQIGTLGRMTIALSECLRIASNPKPLT